MGAFCVFHNDYYDPELRGTCGAETSVPEGCPMHVVTPGNVPEPQVFRGMQPVMVSATTTLVDTISIPMDRRDHFDCACSSKPSSATFDRHAVTASGARAGDVVYFDHGQSEWTQVIIDPAGPCPAPVWPTDYTIATRCDQCAVVPSSDDPGGCATSDSAGIASALLAAVLVGHVSRGRARR